MAYIPYLVSRVTSLVGMRCQAREHCCFFFFFPNGCENSDRVRICFTAGRARISQAQLTIMTDFLIFQQRRRGGGGRDRAGQTTETDLGANGNAKASKKFFLKCCSSRNSRKYPRTAAAVGEKGKTYCFFPSFFFFFVFCKFVYFSLQIVNTLMKKAAPFDDRRSDIDIDSAHGQPSRRRARPPSVYR